MIKISVSASRTYDVIMQQGAFNKAGLHIADALKLNRDLTKEPLSGKKICIITDENVNTLYGQPEMPLQTSLRQIGLDVHQYVFPGGEKSKTMDTITAILNHLAENKFSRSDLLLALGGGITGDVTGFAAASYLRGIEYIQVPTTLLAIVDSSVGGKTGVNLNAGKNLAGAFWQPSLVLFDSDVLSTLSYDLKLDGIAEAIKAGCIADRSIIQMIHNHATLDDDLFLTELAAKAVHVKKQVVEEDERESGSRQLLNFGHTIAHAIEKCSDYKISHGHAVATGMAIISAACDKLGWSETKCGNTLLNILRDFKFPLNCPYDSQELTKAALQDKKIRGDHITIVIPASIGHCILKTIPVDALEDLIACGIHQLKGSNS